MVRVPICVFEGSIGGGVEKMGPLEERVCKTIARQVLLGLAHLHERFLIHRDIKPDNILMCVGCHCSIRISV